MDNNRISELAHVNPVRIHRNTLGDTRVEEKVPTIGEFDEANIAHINEVSLLMDLFSLMLHERGLIHDNTKVTEPYHTWFYREFADVMDGKLDDLTHGDWCPYHYNTERHHLNRVVPSDVNLIDVIEMLCDCVCAGLARSGSVREITLSPAVLEKAVQNTVELLKDHCELAKN